MNQDNFKSARLDTLQARADALLQRAQTLAEKMETVAQNAYELTQEVEKDLFQYLKTVRSKKTENE